MRFTELTWADVDPDRHPFDPDTVLDVVRAVAPAGGVPAPYRHERGVFDAAADRARWDWQRAMGAALVDHYGPWALGWNAEIAGRAADGALVLRWSGARDSITTPEETLAAVAGSLLDWRTFLEEVAEFLPRHLPLPAEPRAAAAAWEAAITSLVAMVAARSGADEHWYPVCAQTLRWFLAVAGVPAAEHDALIDVAIGGRYFSFVFPLGAEVADVAESVAAAVTGTTPAPDDLWPETWPQDWPNWRGRHLPAASHVPRVPAPVVVDALAVWRRVRQQARWERADRVTGPARAARDGIAEHFAKRGSGAAHLLAALELVRADAAGGGPLTFARLETWQREVLGVAAARFRAVSAWARAGAEHYPYRDDLPDSFAACLAEATDPAVPLPARAARVYLDIVHFHPFADGNARSAALAVYFVLAREGVVLSRAAPLLMTRWPASVPGNAEGLAAVIALLIRQTGRLQR
ncbi:filamentation induced by cAMP protein fic [Actinoplanes sp. SE50]|uniref:Fic family protein n=1 Tax=unclassified Actinoplanes TaxID=2626549 RepID=UPI00023EC9E1|nr:MULTISPECIES: Fic family protein [unclassified Actinoplanes]AEV86493.1 filamentation induced by cAMP protein Fic [Actinoplanes sp. SE50/110]ATO84891.1 filamentation induced by cAMP protein fic [Actinoplanes sp. SE50]SLM02300.1 hypothetical protein ACSP50_5539 [Actinoplanes sp. SE50/110]